MVKNLVARLYCALGNRRAHRRRPQRNSPTCSTKPAHMRVDVRVEKLEDRLTPSNSSVLLPAFYRDLLSRAPDYPAASFYANELDSGVDPAQVALQLETSSTHEYWTDLV